MKKILKVLLISFCCVLTFVSSFFVIANRPNSFIANAANSYFYDLSVSDDYTLPDNAISSIDRFDIWCNSYYHFSIDTDSFTSDYFPFLYFNSNFSYNGFNARSICFQFKNSLGCCGSICIIPRISGHYIWVNSNALLLIKGNGIYDFYITSGIYSVGLSAYSSSNVLYLKDSSSFGFYDLSSSSSLDNPIFLTPFSYSFDMNSDTNLSFACRQDYHFYSNSYIDLDLGYFTYKIYSDKVLGNSISSFVYSQNSSVSSSGSGYGQTYSAMAYDSSGNKRNLSTSYVTSFDFSSFYSDISLYYTNITSTVTINRPVSRVNNSLILYNFDYSSFISSISSTRYSLSKGNDIYYCDYDDYLPNQRYIVLYNDDIQNNLFDEYIFLYFRFSNDVKVDSYIIDEDEVYSYKGFIPCAKLGFDFNFTYYSQPLVANNGSYNYTFQKPAYVDGSITFSIAPPKLNIPVLAWVENAFIFLCFYCPIISDIVSLVHLDLFIGGLLSLLNLFITSGIGDFILSCLAFLIYYYVLKSLIPVIVSTGGVILKDGYTSFKQKRINHKNYNKAVKDEIAKIRPGFNKLNIRRNLARPFKVTNADDKLYMKNSSFIRYKSRHNISRNQKVRGKIKR